VEEVEEDGIEKETGRGEARGGDGGT